jgi:hypothetical protein
MATLFRPRNIDNLLGSGASFTQGDKWVGPSRLAHRLTLILPHLSKARRSTASLVALAVWRRKHAHNLSASHHHRRRFQQWGRRFSFAYVRTPL